MKFHGAILCVYLVQMCSGLATDTSFETKMKQKIRDEVNGASEQFIDDFVFILKKIQNRSDVKVLQHERFIKTLSKDVPTEKNAKIDVQSMRDYQAHLYDSLNEGWMVAKAIDTLKLQQSFLSKYVPAERLNGLFNLYFALAYPNATSEEIESALGYLYGTDIIGPKYPLLDIPSPTPADCPDLSESYSKAIDGLNLMVDIRRRVIGDVIAIRDKFPCIERVLDFVKGFVSLMDDFRGVASKIDACTVAKNSRSQQINFETLENGLLTRLPDETFRGIMSFIKAAEIDTPMDHIQKALGYLYDDVPEVECP